MLQPTQWVNEAANHRAKDPGGAAMDMNCFAVGHEVMDLKGGAEAMVSKPRI